MIVRKVGPKASDEEDAHYEGRIHAQLLGMALDLVLAPPPTDDVPGPIAPLDSTPEEARRLFERHPRAFDEPRGIKFSVFKMSIGGASTEPGAPREELVRQAHRRMESLLTDYADGRPASEVAAKFGLRRSDWWVVMDDWIAYPRLKIGPPAEGSMEGWPFAAARRPGESQVVDLPEGEILGTVIHAVRAARMRTFEEASEDVFSTIFRIREARRDVRRQLTLIEAASIEPASIFEELRAQAREHLRRLDADPVWRDVDVP